MKSEMPVGWGFKSAYPTATLKARQEGGGYTEEEQRRVGELHTRIVALLLNTAVEGTAANQDQRRKARFFVGLVLQHFQGYLLGHQHLAEIVKPVSRAGEWAGFPAALTSAFVGMVAEAAANATPRKGKPKTPLHAMLSGGALVEAHMFDENGNELMLQGEACEHAAATLKDIGYVGIDINTANLRKWHKLYRDREGLPALPRGPRSAR